MKGEEVEMPSFAAAIVADGAGAARARTPEAVQRGIKTLLERHGESYYDALAATGRKAFKQRLATDEEYRHRLGETIRAGRLRAGSARPPVTKTCAVPSCAALFSVPACAAGDYQRCPACIAAGRRQCRACGREMVLAGGGSRPRCDDCRSAGRTAQGPRTATRLTVTCRGVQKINRSVKVATPTGESTVSVRVTFDRVGHAAKCSGTYERTAYQLAQIDSFEPESRSFQCRRCHGLEELVTQKLAQTTSIRRTMRLVIRTWDEFRALLRLDLHQRIGFDSAQPKGKRWRNGTDKRFKSFGDNAGKSESLVAFHAEGKTWDAPAEWRERVAVTGMVRAWQRVPRQEARQCLACGKIRLAHLSQRDDGTLHPACRTTIAATNGGRDWLIEKRRLVQQLQRDGHRGGELDRELQKCHPLPWAASTPGQKRSTETLTRHFRWAVLRLLGDVSAEALARESSVSSPAVSQAMKDVLALLPDPKRADPHTRMYADRLRLAAAARQA